MNPRTLSVLEYDKILERLAEHCSFSGGVDLAKAQLPSDDLHTVQEWLHQTGEAFTLLEQKNDIGFGGVSDVRPYLESAERRAMLVASDLLEVKSTLMRSRNLQRTLTRLENAFPHLAAMASGIEPCDHVVTEISRCISERSEVVDAASPELGQIRSQLRTAQDRLLGTLNKLVHNPDVGPYLQETLVTQRQGRYVIPVRAENKGQIQGIVHDQSASGATLFIEPIKVVEQNNAVRELELKEEKEVRRILIELTELVADEAHYIRNNVHVLAQLDLVFAKAKYAYKIDGVVPEVVPFREPKKRHQHRKGSKDNGAGANNEEKSGSLAASNAPDLVYSDDLSLEEKAEIARSLHPGSVIDLRRARHPLLDPISVVPIDIYLDETFYLVVVTGPNTGGKTVTLKTVGLLALMAQSGMMIPTEPGSKLCVFDGIYADIGDEQSIEQSLSTFSSHMTNIISILEEADPHSMVLMDELGAGTDPDEGSALAMALLENLRDRGITTFATTHYSDLKLFAHNTPGVRNASVEFDVKSLSPTYELSIGLPGRSNALTIARRLGLNPSIIDSAENIVRPDTLEADALLADIKDAKMEAQRTERRAKDREHQAALIEADLRYQLAKIEETRRAVIADAREIMQDELEDMRKEIDTMRRQLMRGGRITGGGSGSNTHEEFLARAEAEIEKRKVDTKIERTVTMPSSGKETVGGPIEVGDRVWVPSLQASGEVLSINALAQEVDVQLGSFRLKLALARVELRQKAANREPEAKNSNAHLSSFGQLDTPDGEIDLRGARVEEGMEQVEEYLDAAYVGRLPFVRIIHGKGTGALRDAIRNQLRHHPLVSKYRAGENGEGGDGVTVANLIVYE